MSVLLAPIIVKLMCFLEKFFDFVEEVSMRGKVAKVLRNKVYGGKSRRNQGATMTKTGLRCDQLRGDYQEEKKEYKSK